MARRILVPILKFSIAAVLVYWLTKTGKLRLEPLKLLLQYPWILAAIGGSTLFNIVLNNLRWTWLMRAQEVPCQAREALPLTLIGLFFNLAMPGSVGGDVVKGYYMVQKRPNAKMRVAASVLIDRIIGMYAFALMALISLCFIPLHLSGAVHALVLLTWALALAMTAFFLACFSKKLREVLHRDRLLRLPMGRILDEVYEAFHSMRHGPGLFVASVMLSLVSQGAVVVPLYWAALRFDPAHAAQISLGGFFFVIPLGQIASAVPLSPGGIGLGQAVFLALFSWCFAINSDLGPTVITIAQIMQILFGFVGAGLYLLRRSSGEKVVAPVKDNEGVSFESRRA